MAIVCFACGYYAWNAKHYSAIKTLLENGNRVQWKREEANWFDRLLGIYRFDSVKCVEPINRDYNFDAIANLRSLEEFRTDIFNVDLSPLMKHAETLQVFSMYDCPFDARAFLSKTKNLRQFSCNTDSDFDLAWLAQNKNLKILYASSNSSRSKHLANFKKLEYLHGPWMNTLEPLRHMTNLEHLNFPASDVRSLEPIKNLKNLKYINFEESLVPQHEIDAYLKSLPDEVKAYGSYWGIEPEGSP